MPTTTDNPWRRGMSTNRKKSISELFSSATDDADNDDTIDGSSTSSDAQAAVHRILCYGDSLTAGTSISPFELYPYAPHLEAALNTNQDNTTAAPPKFMVRHRGMPGWTASAMVDATKDGQYGLQAAIQGIQNPALSLVVILAGTNDLGYALQSGGDDANPAEAVLKPIRALHELAWAAGVTKTMAVAIPPSGYQARVTEASYLALECNQALEEFCEASEGKATFVPFPFDFEFPKQEDDDTTNWSPDGLHFSPKGYQLLGEYLKDPVVQVLNDNI